MPRKRARGDDREALERAEADLREGKAPSTAAGEFVREEIEHVREGEHGARSTKQAIAIGLSKARRLGVPLPPPKAGTASRATIEGAERASEAGRARTSRPTSPRRSHAVRSALRREPRRTASSRALALESKGAAKRRSPADRSAAAKKSARTRAGRGGHGA